MKSSKSVLAICALALWAILAVLFGIYDLPISQAIVDVDSPFGLLFQNIGMAAVPIFAIPVLLVLIVFLRRRGERPFAPWLLFCYGSMLGCAGFGVYLFCRFSPLVSILLLLLLGGYYGVVAVWILRLDDATLQTFARLALICAIHMASILVVLTAIKYPWGRWRYRNLLATGNFDAYSPWFIPQGFTGLVSFPSGHSGNACITWELTLLVPYLKKRWQKVLCYLVPFLWIPTVAFSRFYCGAHFASDVLFGVGLSILMFYIIKAQVEKRWH